MLFIICCGIYRHILVGSSRCILEYITSQLGDHICHLNHYLYVRMLCYYPNALGRYLIPACINVSINIYFSQSKQG